MVDSFIHEQNEYSMEETEPLRFSVFVLERVQRMPEHDALLSELRIEIAVLDAELRSPEALIEFNKSMADRFRKMGLDFLAEAAEDLAQASISKRKKTIS